MILFINACARKESRTKKIADCFLSTETEPVTEVRLFEMSFPVFDESFLAGRDRLIAERRFDDDAFFLARQFSLADKIVVAAPLWDLSFPASVKQYFEQINVPGVTFFYTPEGVPESLCRAKSLTYITSVGGDFFPEEFGFGYIKALAENFYGIKDVRLIKATGLDLDGADADAIVDSVCKGML